MPPIRRRKSAVEYIKSVFNLYDFCLWLWEVINTHDWEQVEKDRALSLGIFLNLFCMIARANSRASAGDSEALDDVFGNDDSTSFVSGFSSFVFYSLTIISVLNALFPFNRRRPYRMYEAPIDQDLPTSSARRVRVDSPMTTNSLFQYFLADGVESRVHPDPHRYVWQLEVWNPLPVSLRLFCLFSPGHVLVYWLSLPAQLSDPHPWMTIFYAISMAVLLSVQMWWLSSCFTQQVWDSTLLNREVAKEYDTKFVYPRTQETPVRDVGTQFAAENSTEQALDRRVNKVDVDRPRFIREFKTSPNPNYARHVDPEGISPTIRRTMAATTTPDTSLTPMGRYHGTNPSRDVSPLIRNSIRTPKFRHATTSTGDGGSMGIYTHANSPLRKALSSKPENSASPPRSGGSWRRGTLKASRPSSSSSSHH